MTEITSISPSEGPYAPGELITFFLANANLSGKTLSCPSGAITFVEEADDLVRFEMINPPTHGDRSSNFNTPITFTLTDGGDVATIDLSVSPIVGGFFGQVTDLTGINANPDANLSVLDWRYGFYVDENNNPLSVAPGLVDYEIGHIVPTDRGVLHSYRRSNATGIWDLTVIIDTIIPPIADNRIVPRNLPNPPLRAHVSPVIILSPEGWGGNR